MALPPTFVRYLGTSPFRSSHVASPRPFAFRATRHCCPLPPLLHPCLLCELLAGNATGSFSTFFSFSFFTLTLNKMTPPLPLPRPYTNIQFARAPFLLSTPRHAARFAILLKAVSHFSYPYPRTSISIPSSPRMNMRHARRFCPPSTSHTASSWSRHTQVRYPLRPCRGGSVTCIGFAGPSFYKPWHEQVAPLPPVAYFASIPVLFPLVGLTQFTQYLVAAHLSGLSPAELAARFSGQGLITQPLMMTYLFYVVYTYLYLLPSK